MLDIINNIIWWALVFSIIPIFWYSTGWNSLTKRYKTTQSPPEIVLNKQNARLMKATNTRIIDVGVCEDGLYMAMNFRLLNIIAQPLLIDWDSIDRAEYYVDRNYGECYGMHLINQENTIAFTRETVEILEERFGRNPITSGLG